MRQIFVIIIAGVILILIVISQMSFFRKNEIGKPSLKIPPFDSGGIIKDETLRPSAVAGSFYPGEKNELAKEVSSFLEQANSPLAHDFAKILIVPHAGYPFSGRVAAFSYKALANTVNKKEPPTIILIGSSHHQYFNGLAIDGNSHWQTPLGKVAVNRELANSLVKANSLFRIDSEPHKTEHSLEVQLPFLQETLADFMILPVLINELSEKDLESVSQTLSQIIDENTFVIASSDLSHYPAYEDARAADKKVIDSILTGDVSDLNKTIGNLEKENIPNVATFLCAKPAIEVAMATAKKLEVKDIRLLNYANSGDMPNGDKSRVVGYASVLFASNRNSDQLSAGEQKELLKIARQMVEDYLKKKEIPKFKTETPILNRNLGAFVTLKEHGQLRGCIGRFEPDIPLFEVVSQMALAAATQDTRFSPVEKEELTDLEYEISVLSPLKRINNWQQIEVGKHGVQVKKGLRTGVFLPQVATENNWGLEEFMSQLCSQKAGLPPDCWKDQDTELYIFTAQVFNEG